MDFLYFCQKNQLRNSVVFPCQCNCCERNASSINTFKSSLNLVYAVPKRNPYYSLGSRSVNSILSSMRTKCSQLKNDLFQNGILLQDKCTCGLSETQYHYFFECGNYTIHKDRLIMETLHICRLTLSFYIEILTPLRLKTKSYLMPSPNML